ncbi:hypothetical protein SAMN00777080_0475 [Aquiflexum balticum DSM 16537]|uniref:Uncharacterized protein n=1 Tax=Aquiflexum balticum DSM 16537 TaxID=758820 RepID=A0A1W2GZ03_9BACT|nr:hypothetical protein [Aquiflexum balticum]SMD41940.1 hypothetical protein SAMN00777080_0475 [Aquiflexum balticum DSM 16537]
MRTLHKISLPFIVFFLSFVLGVAQENDISPLFENQETMEIKLSYSIKALKKEKQDSVYFPSVVHYKVPGEEWDSLTMNLRARGNFRRNNCFFPPIRIKIKKKDAKGTLFEGNNNLKLVVPCQSGKADIDLVMKEYLCYKLSEPVIPYHFKTRLANLTLIDISGKNPKTFEVKGFFIEDDDVVAKRHNSKIAKDRQIVPLRQQALSSVRIDFFEFMIANTDWSAMAQHNIKVMQTNDTKEYIPIPYDFDMSGLVNANYAVTSELLSISNVRQRIYRGFCRTPEDFEQVRAEFIEKESQIMKSVDDLSSELNPKDIADIKLFLGEFFNILKSDKLFNEQILSQCRAS